MIRYIVKQYTDDDGKPTEREIYNGPDLDRAQFYRGMYHDAYIMVTTCKAKRTTKK